MPRRIAAYTPNMPQLFTIADLGGWSEARPTFFDPDDGVVAQIFSEIGRSQE